MQMGSRDPREAPQPQHGPHFSPGLAALPSPLVAGVDSHTVCVSPCKGDLVVIWPGCISGNTGLFFLGLPRVAGERWQLLCPGAAWRLVRAALRPWTLDVDYDLDLVSFPNSSAKLPEPLPLTAYLLILACSAWRRWHQSEPISISSAFPCLPLPQRALSLLPSLRVEQQPWLPLAVLGTMRSMTSPWKGSGCGLQSLLGTLTLICSCGVIACRGLYSGVWSCLDRFNLIG